MSEIIVKSVGSVSIPDLVSVLVPGSSRCQQALQCNENLRIARSNVSTAAQYAYTIVLSNDYYLDGALALGKSLQVHSTTVRAGVADLVCLVPDGKVTPEATARLPHVGWRVVYTEDLSRHFPKGLRYADSFNKLAVFGLLEYKKVVFMDTDMLAMADPDDVLKTVLPGPTHIGAIGGSRRKDGAYYFQTGMMVFTPSDAVFTKMMDRFDAGLANPDKHSELKVAGARDGSFLRNYFEDRHVRISKHFSWHMSAGEKNYGQVVMTHFRGKFKPWDDASDAPLVHGHRKKYPQEATFGIPYVEWWRMYNLVHEAEVAQMSPADRSAYGGGKADPDRQYWMLRTAGSKNKAAYMRDTLAVAAAKRNLTNSHVVLVGGVEGASCDRVCTDRAEEIAKATEAATGTTYTCDADSLAHAPWSDEAVLHRVFPGDMPRRVEGNYFHSKEEDRRACAPHYVRETSNLVQNMASDPYAPSTCAAAAPPVARACPCVPAGVKAQLEQWNGDAHALVVVPT
eukprot:TRINITY_DN3054_c0_g1_i2.p1 TRINITY_DN3054_c0_g1~~TRINITY_DN3054_c0_g1_i2.p1  ORF type:complete len:561 (+),score=140.24 TRINITY_DN3054_c0_g1_i2:152-1684(+)